MIFWRLTVRVRNRMASPPLPRFAQLWRWKVRSLRRFGATAGIVANRIAKGKFSLDGKEYSPEINNPPDNLHSGSKGLSRTIWKAEPLHERHAAAVRFTSVSPDCDGGFRETSQSRWSTG